MTSLGRELGGPPLPAERLHDCVNVLLSYQNPDGGWATYENQRSHLILEVWGWLGAVDRNDECCFG